MKLTFNTQDIINAVCVSTGYDLGRTPNTVDAEIGYDDKLGFWATGQSGFRKLTFNESSLRDAIAVYLKEYHHFIPEHLHINMTYFPEVNGFEADILVVEE
jgi:hypothetical protein